MGIMTGLFFKARRKSPESLVKDGKATTFREDMDALVKDRKSLTKDGLGSRIDALSERAKDLPDSFGKDNLTRYLSDMKACDELTDEQASWCGDTISKLYERLAKDAEADAPDDYEDDDEEDGTDSDAGADAGSDSGDTSGGDSGDDDTEPIDADGGEDAGDTGGEGVAPTEDPAPVPAPAPTPAPAPDGGGAVGSPAPVSAPTPSQGVGVGGGTEPPADAGQDGKPTSIPHVLSDDQLEQIWEFMKLKMAGEAEGHVGDGGLEDIAKKAKSDDEEDEDEVEGDDDEPEADEEPADDSEDPAEDEDEDEGEDDEEEKAPVKDSLPVTMTFGNNNGNAKGRDGSLSSLFDSMKRSEGYGF